MQLNTLATRLHKSFYQKSLNSSMRNAS